MPKRYRLFSLCVESCIDLPETPVIGNEIPPDVVIEYKSIQTKMRPAGGKALNLFGFVTIDSNCMQFGSLAGVYEISNGNHIAIDPEEGATQEQIRLFLLGTSMGILLTQRGLLPLHGGAVVVNGKAVVITGHAGAGKSTITSTLVKQGLQYLTDDVSTVMTTQEGYYVLPSYPQRKLVRDACVRLGFNPSELPVVDPIRDKFAIRDSENWHNEKAPFAVMVRLVPAQVDDEVKARVLNAKESIELIVESLYRNFLQKEKGVYTPNMFKQFLLIASKIKMLEVSIPRNIENLEQSTCALIEILNDNC